MSKTAIAIAAIPVVKALIGFWDRQKQWRHERRIIRLERKLQRIREAGE